MDKWMGGKWGFKRVTAWEELAENLELVKGSAGPADVGGKKGGNFFFRWLWGNNRFCRVCRDSPTPGAVPRGSDTDFHGGRHVPRTGSGIVRIQVGTETVDLKSLWKREGREL